MLVRAQERVPEPGRARFDARVAILFALCAMATLELYRSLGLAAPLDRPVWQQHALWWAAGGIVITGFLDVAVSFYLAFRLALTAQNVTGVDRRRLYAAMGRRALRQPLSFLLPMRVAPAAAVEPDADAHEARESG